MVEKMRLDMLVTVLSCLSSSSDLFTKPSIINEITTPATEQQCQSHFNFNKLDDRFAKLTEQVKDMQTVIDKLTNAHKVHFLPVPQQVFNSQCELKQRQIDNLKFYALLCDIKEHGNGWTMVAHRFDRSVDFDKGWDEWKYGFGSLDGEFFLGLEKIQAMTSKMAHEMLIVFEYPGNIKRYSQYDDLQIADESEDYKLTSVGNFSGDAINELKSSVGKKFSAPGHISADCAKTKCDYSSGVSWFAQGAWYCCYQRELSFHKRDQEGIQKDIKWFVRPRPN